MKCLNQTCDNYCGSDRIPDITGLCYRCYKETRRVAHQVVPPRTEGDSEFKTIDQVIHSTSDRPYGTKAVTEVYRIRKAVHPNSGRPCSYVERFERRWILPDRWVRVASFANDSEAISFIQNLQQPMKYYEVKRPA